MPVACHNPYTFTSLAKEDFTNHYEKLHIDYSKFKHVGRPQYKKPYKHQDEIYTSCDSKYLQQYLVEVEESRTAVTSLTMIWSLMTLGLQTTKTPRPSLLVEIGIPLEPTITEVLFGEVGTWMTMGICLMSPCPTPMWSMITTTWGWSQTCLLPCGGPSLIPFTSIF